MHMVDFCMHGHLQYVNPSNMVISNVYIRTRKGHMSHRFHVMFYHHKMYTLSDGGFLSHFTSNGIMNSPFLCDASK